MAIRTFKTLLIFAVVAAPASLLRADDVKPPAPPNPAPAGQRMVTQIYDIRALMRPVYDFSLDSSPHSAAFNTPANVQTKTFDYRLTGPRYPSRALREDRESRLDTLIFMIQDIDRESWDRGAGVRSLDDLLTVTQTPENQKRVAALLERLKKHRGDTIRVAADWIVLPRSEVNKLLKDAAGAGKPNHAAPEVDAAALEKLPAAARRFHTEVLCLNGQIVSCVGGRERTVTVGQTTPPEPSRTTAQALVGNAGSGIALQVNPVADREQKTAVITFLSTFNDAAPQSPPIPARSAATTQSSSGRPTTVETAGSYREQNSLLHEVRTEITLPLGVPVIAGRATVEPAAGKANEMVLILTVY